MVNRPTPLTKEHDVSRFDSGKPALTHWLRKNALQSQNSGQSKTLVICEPETNIVIGYYAFSVVSVEHENHTPERVKKGLAKFPIPVFLLARLAVDIRYQGQGLGGRLLAHALRRAAAAAENDVPIRAIVVDALDDEAKNFYSKRDFVPWPIDGLRMWLMIKDLQATLRTQK